MNMMSCMFYYIHRDYFEGLSSSITCNLFVPRADKCNKFFVKATKSKKQKFAYIKYLSFPLPNQNILTIRASNV